MDSKTVDIDSIDITENPWYYTGDEVAEICKPLFDKFGVSFFNYVRLYIGNGEVKATAIGSSKDFVKYYVQSVNPLVCRRRNIYTFSSVIPAATMAVIESRFKFYNGIILEKQYPDYIEGIEIAASSVDRTPLEFCYNKELFNQFLVYFKSKARHLIKLSEQNQVCAPMARFTKMENPTPKEQYLDFLEVIKTQKILLQFQAKEIFFSQREFEILSLLLKGKTMCEIAQELNISPRTVEVHLYRAKDKTKAYTVNAMLNQFASFLY